MNKANKTLFIVRAKLCATLKGTLSSVERRDVCVLEYNWNCVNACRKLCSNSLKSVCPFVSNYPSSRSSHRVLVFGQEWLNVCVCVCGLTQENNWIAENCDVIQFQKIVTQYKSLPSYSKCTATTNGLSSAHQVYVIKSFFNCNQMQIRIVYINYLSKCCVKCLPQCMQMCSALEHIHQVGGVLVWREWGGGGWFPRWWFIEQSTECVISRSMAIFLHFDEAHRSDKSIRSFFLFRHKRKPSGKILAKENRKCWQISGETFFDTYSSFPP